MTWIRCEVNQKVGHTWQLETQQACGPHGPGSDLVYSLKRVGITYFDESRRKSTGLVENTNNGCIPSSCYLRDVRNLMDSPVVFLPWYLKLSAGKWSIPVPEAPVLLVFQLSWLHPLLMDQVLIDNT